MELRSGAVVGEMATTSSAAADNTGGLPPAGGILASPEQISKFDIAVRCVLVQWTALRLAIDNQWGGDRSVEKAEALEQQVLEWFHRGKGPRWADELDVILDEALLRDFNCEVEDGSPAEIADLIIQLYDECSRLDYLMSDRLIADANGKSSKTGAQSSRQEDAYNLVGVPENLEPLPQGGDSDSSGDEMMVDGGEEAGGSRGRRGDRDMEAEVPEGPKLSAEEISDGWEVVPTKSKRKGKK